MSFIAHLLVVLATIILSGLQITKHYPPEKWSVEVTMVSPEELAMAKPLPQREQWQEEIAAE